MTSTISNTISDLAGNGLPGISVVVRLKPGPAFRISDASELALRMTTVTDVNGDWSLLLEEQANITPDGTWYEVEERIPDAYGGPRLSAITVGASDATLYESLAIVLPVGASTAGLTGPQGQGLTARGAWSSLSTYAPYDVVSYSGSSYIALLASTNVTPGTDATKWMVMAAKGDTGATGATGAAGTSPPAGMVSPFAGSAAPTGWLLCDGSSVLRATYAALFAVIGTTYGSADGTHFTLPDLMGRSVIGVGAGAGLTSRALAATGGEETHALTIGELAAHTHSNGYTGGASAAAGGGSAADGSLSNTGSTGSGTAHNNMQPFLALNFIIKT